MRAAVVIFDEGIHLLDHMAPLAVWLGFPLLVSGIKEFDLAKIHYPEADVRLTCGFDLTPRQLMKNYELILYSQFCRKIFEQEAKISGLPFPKTICVPHGNSDKRGLLELFGEEDFVFVYGQRMKTFFHENNISLKRSITVGNWRKSYFDEREEFYQKRVDQEVFSQFAKKQKTVLYAPTWKDEESPLEHILRSFPEDLNLIVKWHPLFTNQHPGVVARFQNTKNVVFLDHYPPIFPILKNTDLYIGDLSSVGYDFLFFKRPLIFLGNEPLYSHRYGYFVSDLSRIGSFILKALKDGSPYHEGYAETFDPTLACEQVFLELKNYLMA